MPAELSSPRCIHALFEARAAAHPDRDALRWRGETLTYAELNARANRLAHHLRARGAEREVPVGVFLPRTPELIVSLLAVLKAGAAYLPLDPAYPPERVEYMLGNTRAPLLVTTAALAGRLADYGGTVVRVDTDAAAVAGQSPEFPAVPVDPANLAYVIYTSGSTGRPKGVQIEHRSTAAVLGWLRDAVSDAERESVLASTSVCFDVSIAEIFGTLCWGGTLVLVENALSLATLGEPVATVAMVPSAAAELARMGAIPPCVRTLALGGEPLRNELAQRLYALGHVDRVLNLYGPTEDTTYSTCKEVEKGRAAPMSVGRAVSGTTVRVLDAALRPVPDGETGEVWMAGAGVSRGYVGAAGMTAERYRPDPLGAPGARMYRTGDLGRILPDGDLDCLGRMDHQVKVRGYRVEPGEIETVLSTHPAVREAAVTTWDDRGEKRLAAWVVAEGAAPAAAELREHVRGHLPEYMVPDAVSFLPGLPHTPNGKVDRLALPEPVVDREGAGEYLAPRTPEEAALARIWSEVLGVDRVGVRDDFFTLGGHSLLATQIVARIRQSLDAEVPLGTIFAMPTIEELARQLADAASPVDASARIPRAPRDRPLPLSYPQESVWFFQHLKPDMRSYNFQATVRITGVLDAGALERTLAEIVRRHEIFRTTFPEVDGAPAQVVHEPWAVHLPVVDLRGLAEGDRGARLDALIAEEFRRPFHLERLPLVRWSLFRLADDEHVFLAVEQHLVHDGWSFAVFLRELTAMYPAFARGEAPSLPEPAVQFGDFAAWQRTWMQTPEAREHLAWWTRRLQGAAPVLELPADRPRPPEMSFRGSAHRVRLSAPVFAAADAFSRRQGVTLFMTLFAAFEALMHRYTGETAFCVGSGVAGRRLRESEDLIGMVVNTIPIRADLSADPSFGELVERVRAAAVETYRHQDVPFAEIVAAVDPERSRGHLPIFQVAFNFHHAPYPELVLGEARMEVEEGLGNESAKFDLNVIVIPRAHQHAGSEVVMIWEFAEDLFDAETVRRMIGHFETLLAGGLAEPSSRVSRLPLLPADEERAVLALAGEPAPYPREASLHALVAEQARLRPHAPAVVHGARTLAYAELDAWADAIAARLRASGVRAGGRVGVAMERSPELVAALLGVVKAGAAYVPIDPGYPAERLAFILGDSGARALLVRDGVPPALRGCELPVVSLASAQAEPAASDETAAARDLGGDALAYVVYTSGSTGAPKGSLITHRGIVRLARGADYLQPGPGDRIGHAATPSFDASTWEIWAPLLNGATVVVIDREDVMQPERLARVIREQRVHSLFLTTVLFNQVAREAPHALAPLREVGTGGEAADADAFARVLEACPETRVLNLYGPSESTTYATWHPVDRAAPRGLPIPLGGPITHTRVYVVDAWLRPVPAGVPGELCVAGDGLSLGYLGRSGLTAERFVPDPFSPAPGGRMYRTGDRMRWHRGVLEFLGRMDQQVKVRGFRIEPGEIEAMLHRHPAVNEAAVVAGGEGERWLAAYVVPAPGRVLASSELREYLGAALPTWMIPSYFVTLAALPKTPAGKVDRRALPAVSEAAPHAPAAWTAPETATEEAVAAIWREVLAVDRVGADDDFFDLGGHSLKATRILSRVAARLGAELPVGVIFDHPTVRGIATLVDEQLARAGPADEELLAWLEGLSDEEAERLLAETN